MIANTLDTVIGAIPVAGDVFDVMFRANLKNMALLGRHLNKQGMSQEAKPVIEGDFVRMRS